MKFLLALCSILLIATASHAGDLSVSVRDAAGRPVKDAVVTVHPASGVPRGPIRFSWPLRMTQQDIQFDPYVLVVPVGGTVSFPNLDRVRHQVYSFSRGNRFEIELFGRDQTRTHTFASVGIAALGCNIHDQMLAYIRVVDTPWAAKTGTNGDVTLSAVPAGGATLRVWHPRLAGRGNEGSRAITVTSSAGRQTFTGDFSARASVR
ncbi:methylamine utilization protein [Brevundimonas variabilis]|uniref:Plastocyanin n=1 Tax=Brevundimonas variabilis TaxID=74312 RepID=A0A7W9CFA5_9CAUL|nr:methylamine utilization protein [Brevundimonas variabilis]MBB5744575.1 plastocyanin [Brevundimonas variabilis]